MRTRVLGFPASEECGVRRLSDVFAHDHGETTISTWRDKLENPCLQVETFLNAIGASSLLKDAIKVTLSAESRVLVCLPPDSKKTAIISSACIRLSACNVLTALVYVIGSSSSQLQNLGKHYYFTCEHLPRPITTEYWRSGRVPGASPSEKVQVILCTFEAAATEAFKQFFTSNIARTACVFVDEVQEMINHYSFRRFSIDKLHYILNRPYMQYRFLSGTFVTGLE